MFKCTNSNCDYKSKTLFGLCEKCHNGFAESMDDDEINKKDYTNYKKKVGEVTSYSIMSIDRGFKEEETPDIITRFDGFNNIARKC